MIVDDSESAYLLLERALKDMGYEVPCVCFSGTEAIASAIEHSPDIILMDINLDDSMDGIVAATEIKKQKEIPVIFVTGDDTPDTLKRVVENNPYGYLQKPYTLSLLGVIIEIALIRSSVETLLHNSQSKLKLSTQILELLNHAEDHQEAISDILFILKSMTNTNEIAIRLRKGDDFPKNDDLCDDRDIAHYQEVAEEKILNDICKLIYRNEWKYVSDIDTVLESN